MFTVRLEVAGMRHAIQASLMNHLEVMTDDIQKSVDEICTPEHVNQIVQETAKREIDNVIREEVTAFYKYGRGREAVKVAVNAALASNEVS